MPATFPGINAILSAQFTLSHGISPSTGTIECAAQDNWPALEGPLTISDGDQFVTLPGCRLGAASFQASESGRTVILQVLDRRWRWRYGVISGVYNVRRADGKLDDQTKKPPRELARLCLQAMGETADLNALPSDGEPAIDWLLTNPAEALAELCERYNCRVILSVTGAVRIVRLGQGLQLPQAGRLQTGGGLDPDEPPDAILLAGQPLRFEARLPLEAVGLDTDLEVKPINDLSYKPSGAGWATQFDNFFGISDTKQTLKDGTRASPRELALQSVFRWYRVSGSRITIPGLSVALRSIAEASGQGAAAGLSDQVKRWQVLPLGASLAATYTDADGVQRDKPAYCSGVFWHQDRPEFKNSAKGTRVDLQPSVDADRGIVQFPQPVVKLTNEAANDGEQAPAELAYHVAVTVKDFTSRQPLRYLRRRSLSKAKTASTSRVVQPVTRDDVSLFYIGQYDADGQPTGHRVDRKQADAMADYYLQQTADAYNMPQSDDAVYGGIQPIQPDGNIVQVSWSTSLQGHITQASVTREHDLNRPTYAESRAAAKASLALLGTNSSGAKEVLANAAKFVAGGVGR